MDKKTDLNDKTLEIASPLDHAVSNEDSPAELTPGAILGGRYLIVKELGKGGIGVVYLARDNHLHSMPVVIKVLLRESTSSQWLKKKFLQESEALARICHPGVVRVFNRGETSDGLPFLVMEYVQGKPLRDVMTPEGMDLQHVASLVRQMGQALSASHKEDVYHRDLKPENIMLQSLEDGEEHVKLIDFGIAKVKNSAITSTKVNIVAGSLPYMAPEQLTASTVSAASDTFSLGVIAYEMVTGRRPFNPDTPVQLAAARRLLELQEAGVEVKPRLLRPSLPDAAQAAILKALSFNPRERQARAREFGDELAEALGESESEKPVSDWPSTLPDQKQQVEPPRGWWGRAIIKQITLKRLAALLILIAVVFVAVRFWPDNEIPLPGAETAQAVSERALSYSILLKKKEYPPDKEVRLPGEVIFSAGDRVRLLVRSEQSGSFYLLNERPAEPGSLPRFNILFPTPTTNNGLAVLAANQTLQIPERSWLFFDGEEGSEKVWLIWSKDPVPQLEAVKKWANKVDMGEIKDIQQIRDAQSFLAQHSASAPDIKKDEEKKETKVTAKADVLVYVLKLAHL